MLATFSPGWIKVVYESETREFTLGLCYLMITSLTTISIRFHIRVHGMNF